MNFCAQKGCYNSGDAKVVTSQTIYKPMGMEETSYPFYYLCYKHYACPISERDLKPDSLIGEGLVKTEEVKEAVKADNITKPVFFGPLSNTVIKTPIFDPKTIPASANFREGDFQDDFNK